MRRIVLNFIRLELGTVIDLKYPIIVHPALIMHKPEQNEKRTSKRPDIFAEVSGFFLRSVRLFAIMYVFFSPRSTSRLEGRRAEMRHSIPGKEDFSSGKKVNYEALCGNDGGRAVRRI